MFDRLGRAAERVADGLSRRGFLGLAGKCALAAGALGALLALPGGAWGKKGGCPKGYHRVNGDCVPDSGGVTCGTEVCPAGYGCCGCACIPPGFGCGAGWG